MAQKRSQKLARYCFVQLNCPPELPDRLEEVSAERAADAAVVELDHLRLLLHQLVLLDLLRVNVDAPCFVILNTMIICSKVSCSDDIQQSKAELAYRSELAACSPTLYLGFRIFFQ